jgi:hypothetical protein
MEGVQGLEVIRVSLQVHLTQEFILQDMVVPDLGGDRGSWEEPSPRPGIHSVVGASGGSKAWNSIPTVQARLKRGGAGWSASG